MLQRTAQADLPDLLAQARECAMALNRTAHASAARLTGGLSPVALALAYGDWLLNLSTSPGTHAWLLTQAQHHALQAWSQALSPMPEPSDIDEQIAASEWQQWPYRLLAHGHDALEKWCHKAARLPGMTPHHADMVRFFTGQLLDMLSPSNTPLNPAVTRSLLSSGGESLWRGGRHLSEDLLRLQGPVPPAHADLPQAAPAYLPGRDVAITPGKVVFRNHLIELIQYTPATPEVYEEPVLIVPSWIMKYYILDLSPHNSMARFLVAQGHTVFMVSWRNPDKNDADLSMDDYLQMGVFDAMAFIHQRLPDVALHAMGYCLGGTLLAIAASALSRPAKVRDADQLPEIASVSLLAAQVDFTEPGEIGVLVDPVQITWLEDMMADKGYLSGRQMAASFQFLHARELVWSRSVKAYLLGEREAGNDLMAWNADVTRMPATMHSQYLRSLFIRNDLAESRYMVEGHPVSLMDLRMPLFVVGTEKDHVSPWPSVYKVHRLTETEVTFLLTSGGHNAGILSEPGHANRRYRVHQAASDAPWLPPEDWLVQATPHEGSWWPHWQRWLAMHSLNCVPADSPGRVPAPHDILCDAPGDYVQVRFAD